ncbi:16S rRNA (guanine527-N7)-methyltransferase [Dethiosulfatibacter aminovorans DSM 17477]|uniref:Ribosomal RNA small subunit methyltransferase G n=1 Tax=Dethiosulfatibacter aminovorans DSM 17477 TaxID=1121476 RepID=A0A1M6AKT1_9FIRM|nr:16S rRNA (guanine(527)-N(7))-methyltransferase RsmG [Dethiosulfatibacter aminovorans]SHI37082.1 16S rRNA (guanine527-N7)-methyltransferase [Dethiosulfatibacter aminovorans DSM 17477]
MKNKLEEMLKSSDLDCTSEQVDKFELYKTMIQEWNKKINITSITEDEDIYMKHFVDSIIVKNHFDMESVDKMIDVGTGGGFPGIPLKIVNEKMDVTLLDSLNKRIIFLEEVVKSLGLQNVSLIHGRAEDFGVNEDYREKFDLSISRAVAPLNILSEYCIPFVKVGGCFISMKSGDVEKEIEDSANALDLLGGRIRNIVKYRLPGTDISRSIIIIEKYRETPVKYPRKAGKPTKKPL